MICFRPVLTTLVVLLLAASVLYAQQTSPDFEQVMGMFRELHKTTHALHGSIAKDKQIEREIWFKVANRFAADPKAKEYFDQSLAAARNSGLENQKAIFLQAILEIACKTIPDVCQLKHDIGSLQEKDRLQDQRIGQLEGRVGQLEENGSGESQRQPPPDLFRGQSPDEPTPADPPVLVPTPDQSINQPVFKVWNAEYLDNVVSEKRFLCRNAVRVAWCVDVPFADGTTYHGDIYQCGRGGKITLLRHQKTR